MLIDMHVTALTDDGSPRAPRETLDLAKSVGLDAILVVGPPRDFDRAAWLDARSDDDPLVFFGVPVDAPRGNFVCVPADTENDVVPTEWTTAEPPASLTVETLLKRMKGTKTAVIARQLYESAVEHPAADLVFSYAGIHAVEIRTIDTSPMASDMALEAGLGMRLPCVSGTGSNARKAPLGHLATVLRSPVATQAELAEALREGEAWPVVISRPKRSSKRRRRRRPSKQDSSNQESSSPESSPKAEA